MNDNAGFARELGKIILWLVLTHTTQTYTVSTQTHTNKGKKLNEVIKIHLPTP